MDVILTLANLRLLKTDKKNTKPDGNAQQSFPLFVSHLRTMSRLVFVCVASVCGKQKAVRD